MSGHTYTHTQTHTYIHTHIHTHTTTTINLAAHAHRGLIRNGNGDYFYFARRAPKLRYYSDVIHSINWKSAVERDGGVYNA